MIYYWYRTDIFHQQVQYADINSGLDQPYEQLTSLLRVELVFELPRADRAARRLSEGHDKLHSRRRAAVHVEYPVRGLRRCEVMRRIYGMQKEGDSNDTDKKGEKKELTNKKTKARNEKKKRLKKLVCHACCG